MAKRKQNTRKKPVVRVEYNPKSRAELLAIYNIAQPLGRQQLVMDSESLTTNQRAVLWILATRSGGDGVGKDPELSYMSNRTVAGGSGLGLSTLAEVWNELARQKLIHRSHTPDNERTYTRVYWKKLIPDSYRWKDMLRREATTPKPSVESAEPIELDADFDDTALDQPMPPVMEEPVAEAIDPRLEEYLNAKVVETKEWGFLDLGPDDLPSWFDLATARNFFEKHGMDVQREEESGWVFIRMPLHETAAMLLNRHAGINVNPWQLKPLNKLNSEDPHHTLLHAFCYEPFASLLAKSKGAGLLVSLFEDVVADQAKQSLDRLASVKEQVSLDEPSVEEEKPSPASSVMAPPLAPVKQKLVFVEAPEDVAPVTVEPVVPTPKPAREPFGEFFARVSRHGLYRHQPLKQQEATYALSNYDDDDEMRDAVRWLFKAPKSDDFSSELELKIYGDAIPHRALRQFRDDVLRVYRRHQSQAAETRELMSA